MEGGSYIDVHYTRLGEWLQDREEVLTRRNKHAYANILALAPRLIQLGKVELVAIRKQLQRLRARVDESARRAGECAASELAGKRRLCALLLRYGLLSKDIIDLCSVASGGKGVGEEDVLFLAAQRVSLHGEAVLNTRSEEALWQISQAARMFGQQTVPRLFAAFVDFLSTSNGLRSHVDAVCEGSLSLSRNSLFPVLSRLTELSDTPDGLGDLDHTRQSLAEALQAAELSATKRLDDSENRVDLLWCDDPAVSGDPSTDAPIEIDWGCEESDSLALADGNKCSVVDALDPPADVTKTEVVRYSTIAALVGDTGVRRSLLEEVEALRAFFIESAGDQIVSSDYNSKSGAKTMGAQAENALTTLTRRRLHAELTTQINLFVDRLSESGTAELLRFRMDQSARDAFVETIGRQRVAVELAHSKSSEYSAEVTSAMQHISEQEAEIARCISEIKDLQSRCERELASLCTPHHVCITGDINEL